MVKRFEVIANQGRRSRFLQDMIPWLRNVELATLQDNLRHHSVGHPEAVLMHKHTQLVVILYTHC